MSFVFENIINIIMMSIMLSKYAETKQEPDEYCQSESFQPRCLKNEVILMKSAIFGRMRIGKCISAKEVAAQGPVVGEDPRYLGCSSDVLSKLDRKCSGKTECDVRVFDIADENIQPCLPGLVVHLEANYDCIGVVDEMRGCVVTASKKSTHILGSSLSQRICGTESQPMIVEAPIGQKISISLLDFSSTHSGQTGGKTCHNYGMIVDKVSKRNTTICGGTVLREKELLLSTGNLINIFLGPVSQQVASADGKQFILRIEAIGCTDLIPPEDTWLKRKDDSIVIGCYSSRQTWQLICKGGKWMGVLGNCSQDIASRISDVETESKMTISEDEQVLAMVAIGGCTLAICLAIVCVGAVCLRRFYSKHKDHRDYKVMDYHTNYSITSQAADQRNPTVEHDTAGHGFEYRQQMPTYSVYVGESAGATESIDVNVNPNTAGYKR